MGEAGHRVTAKSWAASPKHPGPKPSLVAAHQRTGFAPQVRPSPTLSVSSSYSLACATAAARASWPRSKIAIRRSMTLTRRRYFAGRITCRWSPAKPWDNGNWRARQHSKNQLRYKSVDLAYNRLHDVIRTARLCRVRKGRGMAKLVFGMNQSLDGYVDHMAFAPSPTLFRHFIEEAQGQAGSVYGRQMYEVMRYWDDDHPEWDAEEHAFAAAWRNQP